MPHPVEALLTTIIDQAGIQSQDLIEEAQEAIDDLALDSEDPTGKVVLSLLSEAVAQYGPLGIEMGQDAVRKLLAGKSPDIDWANPRTASDAVALLQNAERKQRKRAREAARKAGVLLRTLGSFLLQAALKGG
jgi:hypothetical protein